MHPVLIAYQAQLLLNTILVDVYVRQITNVNAALGTRTGSGPNLIAATIPAVDEPVSLGFKNDQSRLGQQEYDRVITFPIYYLGSNKLKLNDYVALSTIQAPLTKQRYEIKKIATTSNLLVTLALVNQLDEKPGLTYVIPIGDHLTFSDSCVRT